MSPLWAMFITILKTLVFSYNSYFCKYIIKKCVSVIINEKTLFKIFLITEIKLK